MDSPAVFVEIFNEADLIVALREGLAQQGRDLAIIFSGEFAYFHGPQGTLKKMISPEFPLGRFPAVAKKCKSAYNGRVNNACHSGTAPGPTTE
jgi:hypothetical protein